MPSSRYYRFKTTGKEERARQRNIFFFWTVFSVAFAAVLWSFFLSPFFRITEIKLPKNDLVAASDIQNLIVQNRPLKLGENLLILSKSRLKADLANSFPAITDIKIKKQLFHSLLIDFTKRLPLGLWCDGASCYYFDKEGIIFKEAPLTEGALILKIQDFESKDTSLGNRVIEKNLIGFITAFNEKINGDGRFKIIEFKIKPASNINLEAVTDKGWSIYLDQSQDPVLTASNLLTITREALKNKTNNLNYVDLRISSRIFYKLK